jgi:amino acid adenylation domain-containing protein
MSHAPECRPIDYGGPIDRPFESFPCSALEGSIIDRFDTTARRFSSRIAVSDCARRLTYADLAILVDRIAAAIAVAVADRPGPVAILLPRDVLFPAAMLGVLAVGRGYVPLDASNPIERNRLIATQSDAAAVVSAGDLARRVRSLFAEDLPVVDIETIGDAVCRNPIPRPSSDDLAYIVYTSGSTGSPKGAYHNHRNLLHDVMQQTNTLHLNEEDRVALVYSPAVIAAIREILMTLLNGASLHILPPQELQPAGLTREIRARGITIVRMVPVLLRRMAEVLGPDQCLDSVRVVGLGSQRVDWSDFDIFRRHFSPGAYLIVGIGATECGGNFCHWFVDDQLRVPGSRLPIGRILPDASVTIAGDDGRPVADGEIGEFVIASRYLALGYWREVELTRCAFTVDSADPKTRIFKTGDMGRMRPDGLLEYIGRNDQQIKLRGHRIEIGEIEFALGECAGVEDAAVVVRRNEIGLPQSLTAYVELSPGIRGLLPRDLLSMLTKRLPGYMIPATLHVVEELPRLPHLKIDRVRLAELDAARQTELRDRASDRLIDEIACIFERIIEMKGANANDTVASVGGDSMHAVIVAAEIERQYHVVLPTGFIEQRRTIGEIADWIESRSRALAQPASIGPTQWYRVTTTGPDESAVQGQWQRGISPINLQSRRSNQPVRTMTLAAEIQTSFGEQRPPHFDQGDVEGWVGTINYLLSSGQLDVAAHGLRHLRERFPAVTYAKRVGTVLDHLPLAGMPLPFEDDRKKDVQIAARNRAKTVLLLFCGDGHKLGLPLPIVHCWVGRLNASLVYLRDFQRCNYLRGVLSLGSTREASLAGLRSIVASLGAERIVCCGNSSGVFGALSYGLDLGAEVVLCMGGVTNLTPEFNVSSLWEQKAIKLRADIPKIELDMRRSYANASRPPRVHLVYGEDFWQDRIHALHLGGLPSVTLHAVDNFNEHNVIIELIKRDGFEAMLHWLVPPTSDSRSMLASTADLG